MASLIPGYEYDIFISYRQKDNKHDGWVTKFVENLKGELESTFKEDISIYFDENPHDRLQETYNVSKSLEGKLRCLIFIPILSQTYCDPASYAWQYEFLAFLRMAENDHFGKDIKLRSGNVASRILPIRIHDLDLEDVKLFEKATGNVIRTLDFVFRTAGGANRPLASDEDHPNDNLNKTYYRDQINKVAIAIKDIIGGIKAESIPNKTEKKASVIPPDEHASEDKVPKGKPIIPNRQKILAGMFISALILFLLLFVVFPDLLNGGKSKIAKDPNGKISIIVNDFENNTNDETLDYLTTGIPELIRVNLGANSKELSVQNTRTMAEFYETVGKTKNLSLTPALSRETARKLKVGAYITGSYQKYENKILVLVKLTDTESDELLWTGKAETDQQSAEGIPALGNILSEELRNFLEIKALKQRTKQEYGDALTKSSEAFRNYIEGMNSDMKNDYGSALISFMNSYRLDSTFVLAAFSIARAYDGLSAFENINYRRQAALWTQKTYDRKEKLSGDYRLWIEMWHAYYNTKNTEDVLKYCGLLEGSESKSRLFWFDIGQTYSIFNKPDKALKLFERIEQISSDWDEDWKNVHFYKIYSVCLNSLKMHERDEKILQKGLELFPEDPDLLWLMGRCAVSTGDSSYVKGYIDKWKKNLRDAGLSLSQIERNIGNLYEQGGDIKKAEEKYRKAVKLDPGYYIGKTYLGGLLIKNNLNVDEGMEYLKEVEKKYPNMWDFDFFFRKSEGLYKQGKYSSADSLLKILRDSCYTANIGLDQMMKKVSDSLNHNN